jgi:hypothetical protein
MRITSAIRMRTPHFLMGEAYVVAMVRALAHPTMLRLPKLAVQLSAPSHLLLLDTSRGYEVRLHSRR